ncbi:Leucine-rich PPR motif-containing protein, mitochondrial [Liparis tanakae]|uniref:Leucine-rich PPR motif-containing protein, mitochondrial n=1 Tax=Liparis tanakae TaxID=230148 RepID=A0A4Z2HEK7_9TELE|nr:Leucine-rich PPR motif-containing protein, mitochondrial [Liparis tanakae]
MDDKTDGYSIEKKEACVVEVVKGMQELELCPDVETLSNYILPVFPSMEAARHALKGKTLHQKQIHGCLIHMEAVIAQLSPQSTVGDMSTDVELMVKITDLLNKDGRFATEMSKTTSDVVPFFLYNLIDSMSEGEVRAQEDKLRKYFNQLQAQNVTISGNIYRGIKNLLDSYNMPDLIKDVAALVDPKDRVSNGPMSSFVRPANLQRALELKQEHEGEMTVAGYAPLINLCCRFDNVEEALNLKSEMSRKDSSVVLDPTKYIALVKALSKNGRVDEAVDILKEMKEKDVALNDTHGGMFFHMLNAVVAKGGVATIQRLQDTLFTLGLAKPTANLCSPLITAYLDSKDLSGALEAAMQCQKLYNHLPRIHDIVVALVEKGDTELLQKEESNNWEKAESVWTKMQEENVIPRERTLVMLADILKNNGQVVPFEVPEVFNVYFSVVKSWLSSHIWLFRLVSSQLISQLIDACCRQRAWQPQRAVQPRHTWYQKAEPTPQVKAAASVPTTNTDEYRTRGDVTHARLHAE